MKVCVIGAATPLGRVVTRNLAEIEGMEVSALQGQLPLEGVLADFDVAIGCLDSDRHAEEKAARAAIEVGVPYLSAAESPETFQALTELDEEASSAGSLVVAGLSWTPGLTNIMATLAAHELEAIANVRVCWTGSCLGPLGPPLLARAIRSFSGDAVVFENDGWRLEPAGTQPEMIFFPEPVGWRRVAICAAAEPLAIPESIQGTKKVWVKGGIFEQWAQPMALRASDPWGRSFQSPPRLGPFSRAAAWVLSKAGTEAQAWSALRVDVTGQQAGGETTITFGIVDQLHNLIAAPLVAGAVLLARGTPQHRGVVSPEQAFGAQEFFALIGERGVRLARLDKGLVPART